VASTLGLVACGSAPLAETPTKLPDPHELGPDAEIYDLDGRSVSLEADVHAVSDHTLRFAGIVGKLGVVPADPLATNVDVTVDTTTASATLGVVADVAKSSSFLDVGRYPKARFVSRAFEKVRDHVELVGELELHGERRPIRVPAALAVDGCAVRFSTEFSINRRHYHVESHGSLDGVVSDGVVVRIHADVPRRGRKATCRDRGDAERAAPVDVRAKAAG
jgi:polyisoprenoid-binding protein YceI